MKIVIVNTLDNQGGAARSAYRLHKSLLYKGIESYLLVQFKTIDDNTILGPETKIQKVIAKLRSTLDTIPLLLHKTKSKTHFSSAWVPFSGIANKINNLSPDIVHLHWIGGGMIKIEDLKKIKAPIVWSLHDMWAFTDGYHNDPAFDTNQTSLKDEYKVLPQKCIYKRKISTYKRLNNLTIVGLSKWIYTCSLNSKLLGSKPHENIPNPINIKTFSPFEKTKSRELFNLPQDKKLVLFGAVAATCDPNKGFKKLVEAIEYFNHPNVEFLVLGSSKPTNPPKLKYKTHYLGSLYDDVSLRLIYSASDVMIVPSFIENLSNAIMESLACGTPVVAFNTGGNSDLIDHLKNGFLAKPFHSKDLANGLSWILTNENYEELCINARNKVVNEFDDNIISERYLELYKRILKKD